MQKGQPVDPSVGEMALFGYACGTLLFADGINMLSSAFCKKRTDAVFFPLFKDIYLSSPYQDIGKVIQTYKDSL